MSKNNQRKHKQAEWDLGRLPSRYEMMRMIEQVAESWRVRRRQFELEAALALRACAEKDWDPEFVRRYECKTEQMRYCEAQVLRCEVDLSELHSGARKGWPLRGEVIYSAR